MEVSVVIPNYNGEKYIRTCLISLFNQSLRPGEIIIVDNNSSDKSIDIIEEFKEKVTLVKLDTNKGFSVAVNEGIKRAKGEFVALLNNDTELDKEWLQQLYLAINKDEKIFSCCSKMLRYDNRNIIDDVGDEYNILGWATKTGDGKDSSDYVEDRYVFSSCAGAAIYRRRIFDEIGLFDENFFAYNEDVDISYRANIYGYKNLFASKAIVYHIGSASSGSRHNDFKVRLAARNNIYLIYKNMPLWQRVVNFLFLLFGIIIKWMFFTIKGMGKTYIKAIIEGIKTRKIVDKVRIKENKKIYWNIEGRLFLNLLNLLKRG